LPDQPPFLSEGIVTADGCFPVKNGYGPFYSFVPNANGGLGSRPYGGFAYRTAGVTYSFAADATTIYSVAAGGFTSMATGLNNLIGVQAVPYASLLIMTNGADPVKKFTPAPTNAIANLGGSPPVARYIAVVGGFTVLGYASGSPNRIAWSDQGAPESWTPSTASEAGVADMATGGDVTGLVGGNNQAGYVYQENRIVRMSYTADSRVWQFDEVAKDVGCVAPGTLATWGTTTFFLSNRGFMSFDGSTMTPIGSEKVDRWFRGLSDRSYIDSVTAVVDPQNSLYIVTLPSAFPANRLLIYNYLLDKWSTATTPVSRLVSGLANATSLEQLDGLYGSIDAIPFSLDSIALRGGYPILLAFDGSNTLGSFTGMPLPATFGDGRKELIPGYRARLQAVRPMTDAPSPQVGIAGSNSLAGSQTTTTYASARASGTIRVRESWNYVQAWVVIPPQSWTFFQGIDLDYEQGSRA
jgi:hypothetical protein